MTENDKPENQGMKFDIKVSTIYEFGKRKDAQGNPHQEDAMFPDAGHATADDRFFVLCDGMGGHDAGEVASQTVCQTMGQSVLGSQPEAEGAFTEEMMLKGVQDAFVALDAKDTGAAKKMGTTMTALKLYDSGAMIAHMGDSRVYHIRPGKTAADTHVLFVTRDHSLVNDLIKIGELTEEEAKTFPQRNVITRAMQPNMERRPKADVHTTSDIKAGDYFYMCSDGMLENMDDRQLCFFFSEQAGDDEEKVKKLILATKDNSDNHTAILVHILGVTGTPPVPVHDDTDLISPVVDGENSDTGLPMGEVEKTPVVVPGIPSGASNKTVPVNGTAAKSKPAAGGKDDGKSRTMKLFTVVMALVLLLILAFILVPKFTAKDKDDSASKPKETKEQPTKANDDKGKDVKTVDGKDGKKDGKEADDDDNDDNHETENESENSAAAGPQDGPSDNTDGNFFNTLITNPTGAVGGSVEQV